MIVKEIKSDSTIIRFDNRDFVTNEENKEILDMLTELIIKNFEEILK